MRISIYLLLATSILFHSCGMENASDSEAGSSDTLATEKAEKSEMKNEHNSQNALDWMGTYVGVLPCDDCEEIQVEIRLAENKRYSRKLVYKGKSKTPLLSAGVFEWNESGTEVTLKSFKGNSQVFKVGENKLIYQLPEGGSDEYILSKVQEKEEEAV